MTTPPSTSPYKRHRFPAEIISHCVWLYFRFCLSYRDVEELMAERGVILTYEAVHYWCRKFGQVWAHQLQRRRPRLGDKWHLDEVFLTIQRERHYLWRAVDQDGNVLDILVQHRRDKTAAKRFFRLKTASDLDIPLLDIGLLYQEGYFRQILDGHEWQVETYPYNEPTALPICPVVDALGKWLHVPLELPGRTLRLRVWQVQVGRVLLYLLDSNDPLNGPADRGITGKLYDGRREIRLLQEMVLGIGGWRLLQALNLPVEVCHLNEGHAAFVVLGRVRSFMQQTGQSFSTAWWATRAGNVFTTHTPVSAGFDTWSPDLIDRYFREYLNSRDMPLPQLLALGRQAPDNPDEYFNMAILALRGSTAVNGVSQLHGSVSRRIFNPSLPAGPYTKCRWEPSRMGCTCPPGSRNGPMHSGRAPLGRDAGLEPCMICRKLYDSSPMLSCGRFAPGGGKP
jgi:DDE domain/Carbohydrate phosphorylase